MKHRRRGYSELQAGLHPEPTYRHAGKGLVRLTTIYLEVRSSGTQQHWMAEFCLDFERLFAKCSPTMQVILIYGALGLTQPEIAEEMGYSLRTCASYCARLGIQLAGKQAGPGIGRPRKARVAQPLKDVYVCSRCLLPKPRGEFAPSRLNKPHATYCRRCHSRISAIEDGRAALDLTEIIQMEDPACA